MQALPYIVLGVACAIELSLIIGSCIQEKTAYPLIMLLPGFLSVFSQFGVDSVSGDGFEAGLVTVDIWNFFLGFFVISEIGVPLTMYHSKTINAVSMGLLIGGAVIQVIGYHIYSYVIKRQNENVI